MDQSPRISVFSITKKDFDSLVKEVDIDWKKIVYEKKPTYPENPRLILSSINEK